MQTYDMNTPEGKAAHEAAMADFHAKAPIVQDAIRILNADEDPGELLDPADNIEPAALAAILLSVLPTADMEGARLSVEARVYWMRVADAMGPDWIREFRRVGAFMDKVDQF